LEWTSSYFKEGYTFFDFLHSYISALWQSGFFDFDSIIFIIGAPFWLSLLIFEHRSFLRSREHYADVAACNLTSISDLAVALDEPLSSPKTSFARALFRAHPPPSERLDVALNSLLLVRPHAGYFAFFGYLCGMIYVILDRLTAGLAAAFSYAYSDASGTWARSPTTYPSSRRLWWRRSLPSCRLM
jgi:hypothetical protein